MFFTPETKGLTLEEMDEVFGDEGGTSAKELEHQADIARRIGLDQYVGGEKRDTVYTDDAQLAEKQ